MRLVQNLFPLSALASLCSCNFRVQSEGPLPEVDFSSCSEIVPPLASGEVAESGELVSEGLSVVRIPVQNAATEAVIQPGSFVNASFSPNPLTDSTVPPMHVVAKDLMVVLVGSPQNGGKDSSNLNFASLLVDENQKLEFLNAIDNGVVHLSASDGGSFKCDVRVQKHRRWVEARLKCSAHSK